MLIELNKEQIERLRYYFDFGENEVIVSAELDDETNCFEIIYENQDRECMKYEPEYKDQFEVDMIMGYCESGGNLVAEDEYEVFAESIHGSDVAKFYSLEDAVECARKWASKCDCRIAIVKVTRDYVAIYEGQAKVKED